MSDYLTDEEQMARLKSWWDENGKSLVAGLVIVVVGVVGYRWYEGYSDEQNVAASDLYEAFLGADGDARLEALAELTDQAAGSSYEALALLQMAGSSIVEADYAAAEQHLAGAVAAAPEPVLADIARLRQARVLQQLDRTDDALAVLGAVRSSGFRSLVAELQGDIHLLRGDRDLAHEAYAAALADAGDVIDRPVLEMKVADTAEPEGDQAPTQTAGEPETQPDA